MNIYDPRDGIVYRHVDQRRDVSSVPVAGSPQINRLPAGYANGSPSTYLRSDRPGATAGSYASPVRPRSHKA